MGPIKSIALAAIVTVSSLGAVLYTSCSKDACKSVKCVRGACVGGSCNCPTGVTGRLCETVVREQYANTYQGNTPGNVGHGVANNTLKFDVVPDTTDYLKMTVTWKDTGSFVVTLPIELTLTSTGSTFSVTPTSSNYKTYSGGGSVSANMASMSLTETDTAGHSEYYTFNNFIKQ